MATWLKQSTAVDIGMGPFLDSGDGNTVESGLTITQPDIRLKKNGGNWAQKNAAQTLSHEENGWYEVALDTTDTDTLGTLLVAIHESGALPVWREFMVVPANVYDSLVGGSDTLQADVAQFGGTNGTFASGRPEVNTTHAAGTAWASGAITAAVFASDAITAAKVAADVGTEIGTAVWATTTRQLTGTQTFNLTGSITGSLSGSVGSVTGNVGGTVNGLTATAQGNVRTAVGLASANLDTQLSTIDSNVDAILVDTDTTIPGLLATIDANVDSILVDTGTDIPAALTTIDGVVDAIQAKTDNLPSDPADQSLIIAATNQILADVATVDGNVDAILVDTGTTLPAQIDALENLSAAQVNAEMVDVLTVDTYAEPGQGAPAATASLKDKIGYLYKAFRNKVTQTSTTYSLYADDASTVDQKATTSDDGTVFTRTEITSGP